MMRLVVPFGFYGAGNTGDEGTLNGFACLLRQTGLEASVSVASRNPAHTAKAEPMFGYFENKARDPRRWFAKARSTAHAFVGGTPIQDILGEWPLCDVTPLVQAVDRWKVPAVFIGIGTEILRRQESIRLLREEIAPRVACWTVRSDLDRQRLIEYGVAPEKVTVAADLAWLIAPAAADWGRQRLRAWGVDPDAQLIAVNLANENGLLDQHPSVAEEIAAGLDRLCEENNARVIFLAAETREDDTFDQAAARRVSTKMKQPAFLAPNEYLLPCQMMSILAACAMSISMRYHFCLFSALQSVPYFGIERSGKVADLSLDLAWPHSARPVDVRAELLAEAGDSIFRDGAALRRRLSEGVERMKLRSLGNRIALDAVIA